MKIEEFECFSNIEDEENIRGLALYINNNLIVEEAKLRVNVGQIRVKD